MTPSRVLALNVRALYCRVWPALLELVRPVDAPASTQDLADLAETEAFLDASLRELEQVEATSGDLDARLQYASAWLFVICVALQQDPDLARESDAEHALDWVKRFDYNSGDLLMDHKAFSDAEWLHWGSQALADLRQELEDARSGRAW